MSFWVFALLATGCAAAHHSEFHQPAAFSLQPGHHQALGYAAPVHVYSAHATPVSAAAPAIYTAPVAPAPQAYAAITPAAHNLVPSHLAHGYPGPGYSAHILSPQYTAPTSYSTPQYKQPISSYTHTAYPSSINHLSYSAAYKSPVTSFGTPQYSALKYESPAVQYQVPTVKYHPSVPAINQYASSANYKPIAVLRHSQNDNFDGSFSYEFEAENGITSSASGYVKQLSPKDQAQVMQGAYSYTAPDGTPVATRWFADETGFHAEGSHLPVAPPVPEAIAKSLAYQGIAY